MSFFYEVNRCLQVKDTQNHPVLVRLADSQPAMLGAAILQERAGIDPVTPITDVRAYRSSDQVMDQEYQKLINAVSNTQEIKFDASRFCRMRDPFPEPLPQTGMVWGSTSLMDECASAMVVSHKQKYRNFN